MFTEPTVFLLGAGASWHYGFPTGEELIHLVVAQARLVQRHLPDLIRHEMPQNFISDHAETNALSVEESGRQIALQLAELAYRIEYESPPTIDWFIGRYPHLGPTTRLLIANVLVTSELQWDFSRKNKNRADNADEEDDWLKHIAHTLKSGCSSFEDIFKNTVNFVTFNYDTSIERALHSSLLADTLLEKHAVERFLKERIVHLYGSTRVEYIPQVYLNALDPMLREERPKFLNHAYQCCHDISVVAPDEKTKHPDRFEQAHEWISQCSNLFILGYGFDQTNNSLLRLRDAVWNHKPKNVYLTNFKLKDSITKAAGMALVGNEAAFQNKVGACSLGLNKFHIASCNVPDALKEFGIRN